jgi:hypothetical protein
MVMTSEAKRALSRTSRELRKRLIDDLGEATERAYRLSIDAKQAARGRLWSSRWAPRSGWSTMNCVDIASAYMSPGQEIKGCTSR